MWLQDDIVHEDLTVRENLEYSAWLRSPKYVRTRAKGDLVDDVIDVLNLRSVQHSVVGTAEKRGIRCTFSDTSILCANADCRHLHKLAFHPSVDTFNNQSSAMRQGHRVCFG